MRVGLVQAWTVTMALLLAPLGCLPRPIPDPEPGKTADCAQACDWMEELGCEAAHTTAEGAGCEEVCQNVQDSGFLRWNLECRSTATTCEAVDRCER